MTEQTQAPVVIDPAILHDTVASRLKRVRVALGLKSAEMAKHIGIGGSKYSNLETDKAKLSDEEFASIDQVLAVHGVPAGWLKGEAIDPAAYANIPAPVGADLGREIWDYPDDALLGELGRRLAEASYAQAVVRAPEAAQAIVEEHGVVVVEPAQPIPAPSDPVAPPAVDVPLPLAAPIVELPVPAAVPQPAPIMEAPIAPAALPPVVEQVQVAPAAAAPVDLTSVVGGPAVSPSTSSFDQPVAVEVGERPLIDVLVEQYGPNGVPPVAFVPPTPAAV